MRELLIVGAGGFLGAVLRHLVAGAFAGASFPYATLTVNAVGSFAIGAVAGFLERGTLDEIHRQFLAVGLLGALTTFSTFSLETIGLLKDGAHGAAALSVLLNVALALLCARVGMSLTG